MKRHFTSAVGRIRALLRRAIEQVSDITPVCC
jgi:hypothetical protein